jgi:DNA-binding LacI/PurR family transcriptional regulator
MARQIGSGRHPCISILALNLATTPYSVGITLAIEQVAREHGWRTYIVNTFSNDPSSTILDSLLALRPEGVVFATMGHRMVKVHERLLRTGVVLANCQTTQKGVACYVPDDEQGQYDGVRSLLEKGYRRPLCIHMPHPQPEGYAYLPRFVPFCRSGLLLNALSNRSRPRLLSVAFERLRSKIENEHDGRAPGERKSSHSGKDYANLGRKACLDLSED